MLQCYDGYDITRWQMFFSSIIIFRGHRNIFGPLLTEKSLYSEWLDVYEWGIKANHPCTSDTILEKPKNELPLVFVCFVLSKSNVELPRGHTRAGDLDRV